jgi:predicted enzyme related to lactoylglutathione lyase
MPYTEIERNGQPMGGMYPMGPEMAQVPPNWTLYFQVDDCDATSRRVKSLGGRLIVEPKDLPNVGRFAVVQDPQGAVFSLYQPA